MTGHNFENLTNKKFGRLTVLGYPYADGKKHMYYCLCECGNRKHIYKHRLKTGTTSSCGCLKSELTSKRSIEIGKRNAIDLAGLRFERLVVISRLERKDPSKDYQWLCKCDCGNEKITTNGKLRTGHVKSCGCYNKDLVTQRHRDYRESKGLDPNIPIDQRERLEFRDSGIIQEILKRDKYVCQCCYLKKHNFNVHHIYHWSTHIELRYDRKNLITLCEECHVDIIHNGNCNNPAEEKTIQFLTKKIEQIYTLQGIQ